MAYFFHAGRCAFDAKEKVFAEVQGRKIELSKLTKKKRDAKPEQVK